MIGSILLCLFFSFTGERVLAQAPTAVLAPAEGFNASLGSIITFNCTVMPVGADIVWRVNGDSDSASHIARGIVRQPNIMESDETIISRIEVSATVENDEITIQCRASGDTLVASSSIVTFRVQGLLDPPSALMITASEPGRQRLSWMAPESLDITGIDPDISHYNVCSSILNEVSCRDVQGLEYTFVSVRIGIDFTVAAVNTVGEGNVSSIPYVPCDSGTAPTQVDANMVTTEIVLQSGTTPSVSFSFTKESGDSNCFDLYRIQVLSNQTTLTQGPLIPTISGQTPTSISLNINSGLTRSTIYNAIITSVNVNGENDSTGEIRFSTYDVQSVETSARVGAVAVTCTFAPGSTATNCAVRVCEVVEGGVSDSCESLTVPRPPSSLTAIQELGNLQPGMYTVTEVSVRNGDGSTVSFTQEDLGYLRLVTVEVTVPPIPTTTPTPTSFTVGPTGSLSSPVNVGTIAGSVIAVVVVIALILILVSAVLLYLYRRHTGQTRPRKSSAARLTNTEMWLDDVDGGSAKRLTTTGEPSPPNLSPGFALGQQPSSPLSDMAVIQGRNGTHVELDLTESEVPDRLELDSVELTEPVDTKVQSPPHPPPYVSLDPSQPDILQHRSPVAVGKTQRPHSGNMDRLAAEDVHEIKLTSSLDNLSNPSNNGGLRTLSAGIVAPSQSADSLGQYAEIDHRHAKKSKKPKDSDLVLYSEINVDELRPVVPQKKRSKPSYTGSLNNDPRLETYHV